jgi:CubicO group peptidase (beta-lactamase class C family)
MMFSRTFFVALCLIASEPLRAAPVREFSQSDAVQLGWNAPALQDVVAFVESQKTTGFLIIRKVILEQNWPLLPSATVFATSSTKSGYSHGALQEDVASAQKSFVAILAGIATDKRLLDISESVSSYLGAGWSKAAAEESRITVRHLLEMSSGLTEGLGYEAPAGERFFYNTPAYAKLKPVLEKVSGKTLDALTREWLTDPLGMTETLWRQRPAAMGDVGNPTGLYTTPRDMAKIGQLVLDGGKAMSGTRVISKEQLRALFERTSTNPAYGHLWWLNGSSYALLPARARRDTALIPAAPPDLVAALGALDRKIYVVPSRKLIVVRTGQGAPERGFDQSLWSRLMKAMPANSGSGRR